MPEANAPGRPVPGRCGRIARSGTPDDGRAFAHGSADQSEENTMSRFSLLPENRPDRPGSGTARVVRSLALLGLLIQLLTLPVLAAVPVFDVHVHLREGEESLQAYQADVRDAGIELAGIGAMWFGGPHQARAGDPEAVRAGNDGIIALGAGHPSVLPVATVHPYDGQAALDELARVAAAGVKVLKLHAHTQR